MMKMIRFGVVAAMALLILAPLRLSAQDSAAASSAANGEDATFAPFINRLRVAVKDAQVRLTWEDIANFTGSYQLYRHSAEITSDNLAAATLVAEVRQGEQFYTDVPAETGSYFYAVLAKEKNGNLYSIFIPFRNKTLNAIKVTAAAKVEDTISQVSDFKASVVGQSVQISLASSLNTRSIAVFRATTALTKNEEILKAVQVWTGSGRSILVEDFAVPGVPYYYAAVDTEAFQKGSWTIVPGANALTAPVEIPLGSKTVTVSGLDKVKPIRLMPLPILTLPDLGGNQPVLDGTNLQSVNQALDPATRAKVNYLTGGIKGGQAARKAAELLPTDRLQLEGRGLQQPSGETKTLLEILAKDFSRSNWEESIRQLGNLLTLPLSRSLQAKAHFYLAQSYYQNGKFKEALMEFLYVQDELSDYAGPWISNTLSRSREW